MKRIFCALLILLTMASSLSACKGSNEINFSIKSERSEEYEYFYDGYSDEIYERIYEIAYEDALEKHESSFSLEGFFRLILILFLVALALFVIYCLIPFLFRCIRSYFKNLIWMARKKERRFFLHILPLLAVIVSIPLLIITIFNSIQTAKRETNYYLLMDSPLSKAIYISANSLDEVYDLKEEKMQEDSSQKIVGLSMPSSINQGGTIVVQFIGEPLTEYSLTYYKYSRYCGNSDLEEIISDERGVVTWSWQIDPSADPGKYTMEIYGNNQILTTYFTVSD